MKQGRSGFNILLLGALYLSQGLPFGFQATALPVYLRSRGVSLEVIGYASALAAPWLFKALWAPLVDRFGSLSFGRRRSWIIPLQILLSLTIFCASRVSPEDNLSILLILVFLMNFFAATQDIAVDGLAVDILGPSELGHGNAAQVVGYKTGMLCTGGLLMWLTGYTGWQGYFLIMAGIALMPLLLLFFFKEAGFAENEKGTTGSLHRIFSALGDVVRTKNVWRIILFIASYKLGEYMIDIMFKPFLIDAGFSPGQIGLWVGTWGMAASLTGSLAGGFLASSISLRRAMGLALFFRLLPLGGELFLAITIPSAASVIAVTVAEHFFGGMLTTVMFAFMMSRVDRRIGATHYTILASIEVFGKSPGAWFSGIIAGSIGYAGLFSIGFFLSAAVLFLVPLLPRDEGEEGG